MTLEFISEDHASIPVLLCNSDTVNEVVAGLAAPAQRWICLLYTSDAADE